MQGIQRAEVKGEVIVVYEAEPLPELSGEIGVSSLVFQVTTNETGETTSPGDLITGTLELSAGVFVTINGNILIAASTTSTDDDERPIMPELVGNLDIAAPLNPDSLPTISCPINKNIVFKKDNDGRDLPIVDTEATVGDYLLILSQANKVTETEDDKLEGKNDITGTIRVTHKSAFSWTFTNSDGSSEVVDSTAAIEDLYNDYESDHTKYSEISSTGDLITGEVNVMAVSRTEMVTPSDNVVFIKDKDGNDTIHIDESKSGDYLFVIGICGATTGYDKDGNPIRDYDLYDKESGLDHTEFDKPSQEINGKIRIAAKITAWIDGTLRYVCEADKDVTGEVSILAVKRTELDGEIIVDAEVSQDSYAFII